MSSTFWTNTIWYILLAITALIQLLAAFRAASMKKLSAAFFMTIMGITLILETTILIFLKAYSYYPMVIKNSPNPFNDVLAGNLFSQVSVSATTLLAVVLDLKLYWYFVIAAAYGSVEELFITLGVYSHNWYRTWITMVMFPFAIAFSKYIYRKIREGVKPVFYYLYIFAGLFSLYVITILWGLQVAGYLDFSTTVFRDAINSRYFLGLGIFFVLPSMGMMPLYFCKTKRYWKLVWVAAIYLLYAVSYRLKLVWIPQGHFWLVTSVTLLWLYFSVRLLDQLYGGPGRKR